MPGICRPQVVRPTERGGGGVDRPRAADDFATIRARMDELRHERERAKPAKKRTAPEPAPDGFRFRPGSSPVF